MDNECRTAIVTGASSGIGIAICNDLLKNSYKVYGFGRDFSDSEHRGLDVSNESFNMIQCDLLDTAKMTEYINHIRREEEISLLVNNAGVGYYGLHEELNVSKIQNMVRTNLEVPMILTNMLLRDLKKTKGRIINISSVTADELNPRGCAYGATKAGLKSFSDSLFEESRKYGIKVTSILPDMTRTNLYRNADFREDEDIRAYLLAEDVAQAVDYIINAREDMVVREIKLMPQLHKISRKKREI